MVRVIIKGGVWRNTEDEVLKAAVMKYGKNQWSRIASLLHRKSAKQCKARWFEWLDPAIKKTEWSRDEDEKLLHLAKLMPTQWRTIAPIVGRTAAQCLERYEQLLDQAQRKAEGEEEASSSRADDPRRLRPGEIDPTPETKPARPDPVDMDEDELEMLSEARARLANTQGKKAKRKAREKQLEEARRLASLQKRRELKAAGLGGRRFRVKKGRTDYNAEIPFEKKVPAGFYDPSTDDVDPDANSFHSQRMALAFPERRDDEENAKKKIDRQKAKLRAEEDEPNKVFSKEQPDRKRSKLVLPKPQISETELEDIIKVGRASEVAREVAGEDGASATLLAEYAVVDGGTPLAAAVRTPRTPATANLDQEAQNLLALQNVQTPLKGGENTPLMESDFKGVTPSHGPVQTPNVVLRTPRMAAEIGATPGPGGFTPGTPASMMGDAAAGTTPFRDRMGINVPGEVGDDMAKAGKSFLQSQLTRLPQPRNEYELIAPELDDTFTEASKDTWVEDAADIRRELSAKEQAAADALWQRQSTAVQRGMPRPLVPNEGILRANLKPPIPSLIRADEMIKRELLIMQHHDALYNPTLPQQGAEGGETSRPAPRLKQGESVHREGEHAEYLQKYSYEDFTPEELADAEELLQNEEVIVREGMGHNLSTDAYSQVWDECYAQVLYVPSKQQYGRLAKATRKDRIESFEQRLEQYRNHMSKQAKKAAKSEKKLKVLLGGYKARGDNFVKTLADTYEQLDVGRVERNSFASLAEHEDIAIPNRIRVISEDVQRQEQREAELQEKFGDLRRDLERELASVSAPAVAYEAQQQQNMEEGTAAEAVMY